MAIDRCIIVSALKGGVGKTTVTVGLARALAQKGLHVGILDLDYRNAEVLIALGSTDKALPGRTRGDLIIPPMIDSMAVMTMAYFWPPTKAVKVSDSDAMEDVKQLLAPGTIAWPDLDWLICDSPPTSAGITIAALTSPGITGVLTVTQPSSLSLAALLRTLDLFCEEQVPVYGIISNQGTDEEHNNRYDLDDRDIYQVAEQHKLPIFLAIPHSKQLSKYFALVADQLADAVPARLPKEQEPSGVVWSKLVAMAKTPRR